MKLKAVISEDAPEEFFSVFGGFDFARQFLEEIVGEILGAKDAMNRPAEYYVQMPDQCVSLNDRNLGVELRLTGVSRNGRKAAQFHRALDRLQHLACRQIQEMINDGLRVQVFCVLMLDGDVETFPGSGIYSSVLESTPVWITSDGIEKVAAE